MRELHAGCDAVRAIPLRGRKTAGPTSSYPAIFHGSHCRAWLDRVNVFGVVDVDFVRTNSDDWTWGDSLISEPTFSTQGIVLTILLMQLTDLESILAFEDHVVKDFEP